MLVAPSNSHAVAFFKVATPETSSDLLSSGIFMAIEISGMMAQPNRNNMCSYHSCSVVFSDGPLTGIVETASPISFVKFRAHDLIPFLPITCHPPAITTHPHSVALTVSYRHCNYQNLIRPTHGKLSQSTTDIALKLYGPWA